MPANVVKSKKDEALWDAAKRRATELGHGKDWDYVMAIFQATKKPRPITYEMDSKEKAALRREAKELGYTYDNRGMPHKKD